MVVAADSVGVVDSAVEAAEIGAIAGRRLSLIETPQGVSGPGLPYVLYKGITQPGPEFPQKTG